MGYGPFSDPAVRATQFPAAFSRDRRLVPVTVLPRHWNEGLSTDRVSTAVALVNLPYGSDLCPVGPRWPLAAPRRSELALQSSRHLGYHLFSPRIPPLAIMIITCSPKRTLTGRAG